MRKKNYKGTVYAFMLKEKYSDIDIQQKEIETAVEHHLCLDV